MTGRALAVAVLFLCSGAGSASAADVVGIAGLDGKRLDTPRARVALPVGWSLDAERPAPLTGGFVRYTRMANGGTCDLTLDFRFAAVRRRYAVPPRLTTWAQDTVAVLRWGSAPGVRWGIGDPRPSLRDDDNDDDTRVAAHAEASLWRGRRLLPRRARGVKVTVALHREVARDGPPDDEGYPVLDPTPRQVRICRRRQRRVGERVLPRALSSLRIVRR